MILTCPDCATRYFAPDNSIGPAGRTVRCANCGTSWKAMPEGEAPLELDVAAPAVAGGAQAGEAAAADSEPAAESIAELPGEELPKVFRKRVKARRENRKAAASGLVWGLAAAGLVAALGTLVVARAEVVRFWPKSATAYALVGLPVNATGLVIENQSVSQEFAEGRPVLVVRGAIRNATAHEVSAPPLELVLLGAGDKPVSRKISQVENPKIPAGEARFFQEAVVDPPNSVTGVELTFALGPEARQPVKTAKLRKSEGHAEAVPAEAHAEPAAAAHGPPALRPAGDDADEAHAPEAPANDAHAEPAH